MRLSYRLSLALAALMLMQSILGLMLQGQYRDAEWIKVTWLGNDLVTLIVAVPLLIVGIIFSARGSIRGLLLWLGMLGYGVYNYAYYMLGATLNTFFLFYVAALVLSVVTLILSLLRIDVDAVAASFRAKTPVRLVGGYYTFVGLGLASVWLIMWAAYAFAGRPTPVEPEIFKVVAALDTSIIVPPLLFGGVLLWRRNAWVYVLSAVAGILGSVYLLVLSVNSVLAIARGIAEVPPGELPEWGTLAVLTIAATLLLLANVRSERLRAR
jgi:hypothetical protein